MTFRRSLRPETEPRLSIHLIAADGSSDGSIGDDSRSIESSDATWLRFEIASQKLAARSLEVACADVVGQQRITAATSKATGIIQWQPEFQNLGSWAMSSLK